MDKQIFIKDNYLLIRMPKEVDHYKSEEIRKCSDELLKDSDVLHVVFDFSDTEFMDSSGIGVIVGRYQKVACFGGKVYAIHVSDRMKRIIEMAGLKRFVEVEQNEYVL